MARQRAVYVVEMKAHGGRKWHEADCEIFLKDAIEKRNQLIVNNPDDKWRVVKYYPRDDAEILVAPTRRWGVVDNRYSGVGYEPPVECANCADLRRQLAAVTAERDRLFELAYPDGPAEDAAMPCSRYRELEAELDRLIGAINSIKNAAAQTGRIAIANMAEAALRREE